MKRPFKLAALMLSLACATPTPIPVNHHGLRVVPDLATYRSLARADADKRLVDLQSFVPGIVLDIRYATTANFMHKQLYPVSRAYLRYPAAVALREVQHELAGQGLGLKIFDAYRPYRITEDMWEPVRDADFVADPAKGSRHNRGAAVDLTLIDLRTGQELEMPSGYDEFTNRARRNFADGTVAALSNRRLLEEAMEKHGYEPLPSEWWHFDFNRWERFELMDVPLESLETRDR